MLVTCICPTFNRPELLPECVYWFTRQDWPDKELIILNDNPTQVLRCEVPGVRVVNESKRYRTLGDKYNALVALARGEVIFPWEDDDVNLPWRLSQGIARLGAYDYWNPHRSWFEDRGRLRHDHAHGFCFNASAVRRRAFDRIPFRSVSGPQDAQWVYDADDLGLPKSPDEVLYPWEWAYVYRWGVSNHLSGRDDPESAYDVESTAVAGEYIIEPRIGRDYEQETKAICQSILSRSH